VKKSAYVEQHDETPPCPKKLPNNSNPKPNEESTISFDANKKPA
jgi:hypothetical protein